MKRSGFFWACCLGGVLLAGCGPKPSPLVGRWRGHLLGQMAATLEMRPDQTFTMDTTRPFQGHWRLDDNVLTLTPNRSPRSPGAPLHFRVNQDSSLLWMFREEALGETLTFRKEGS
jgi:hypothetical protein